jgi:hypothetical protein
VFFPATRMFAIAMAAVLCFVLLVPFALQRHNPTLALAVTFVFAAYLVVNVLLWSRLRARH